MFKVIGDRTGGVWAVSQAGIAHVHNGVLASYFELPGLLWAAGISVDADGSLWVVRGRNTVSDAPLCHVTDSAVRCFGKSDGIPISPADALLADGTGGFWIGGQTALVHWRAGVSQTYSIDALTSNAGNNGISSLARIPDGTLWVGVHAQGQGLGLGQLREGVFVPFVTPAFDGSKLAVYTMIVDRAGNLWVGTDGNGIFRIQGNIVDHYGRSEGLSSDTVFALFEDREGIVWATTTQGIDSFRDSRITTFSTSEGLGKDAAIGVLASSDGEVWLANSGSLDRIVNGSVSSIRAGNGLPGAQVTSLLEDRAGNLWVGVDDGLYLFKNGRFRRLPEPDHKPLGLVVGMTEDLDGNIWAACAGNPRKLVRIRDFQVREEFVAPRMPPGHTLAPDPRGGIWIGTLTGDLVRFRHGAIESFSVRPKGNPVSHQIVVQADGSVLAAYEDGLVGLRRGSLQKMTTDNGLPCNTIISFIQDKEKRWWLYSACGVVELADSELRRWWADPAAVVQTRLYDVLDGAQPHPPSFNSAAYSSDGRVWFATGMVVQMVNPSRLSDQAAPAATYIESVIVDRKTLATGEGLVIAPNPRDLQIDYTSTALLIPQKVKFRYRLEGRERDWHEAGTRRQAFYTDLPPGQYSFRVIASNSDGIWNEHGAALDFSVAAAYYQTRWFQAVLAIGTITLLWAAYQLRIRRVAQQFNRTLDARVSERTRIARELHDTLLQSFHGLVLRFQSASTILPARPDEAKARLDRALDQAEAAITEGRNAVQGLRSSATTLNDLANGIAAVGAELTSDPSASNPPAIEVNIVGESRDLNPVVRDEAYRIAGEALRNAVKHAQARQIIVTIHYESRQLRLTIRDDGTGMDEETMRRQQPHGHFGLPGMRERAAIVRGRLEISSAIGSGTEIELRVPGAIAYGMSARPWLLRVFARPNGHA